MFRHLSIIFFLFVVVFSSVGQNLTIDEKKATLKKLNEAKTNLDKKIKAIESDIAALTPVPKPKKWTYGGFNSALLNQIALVNWAAGGSNSVTVTLLANVWWNFKHGKHLWENNFDAVWGISRVGNGRNIPFRKSDDGFQFTSKYGYQLHKIVYAAALLDLRSQFTWTKDFNAPGIPLISKFGAPAFMVLSLGFDVIPNADFSLFFSPVTGKMTFVRRDPRIDETRYGVRKGSNFRGEFGAYIKMRYQKEIWKNIGFWTTLALFNNYSDPVVRNRGNIDVDWQVGLNLKVNKYLSANLFTYLIYDHDVQVTRRDGTQGPGTQFKEVFGVSLSYNF